ncbi:hypothetical protein VNO78_14317 [Psophocarpus tetragonolobus]|uniref:Uncharacterized protein n=1 Tax=Psophocarpus tetragonolobus TaxID=3891 RepID=A0AAN9SR12_PSOTE
MSLLRIGKRTMPSSAMVLAYENEKIICKKRIDTWYAADAVPKMKPSGKLVRFSEETLRIGWEKQAGRIGLFWNIVLSVPFVPPVSVRP